MGAFSQSINKLAGNRFHVTGWIFSVASGFHTHWQTVRFIFSLLEFVFPPAGLISAGLTGTFSK